MDDARQSVRAAVTGADRAFQVIEGGVRRGGGGEPPEAPADGQDDQPPITALGHLDGTFHLLDVEGQARSLSARQLGSRHDLLALFLGKDAWLKDKFPKKAKVKVLVDGEETEVERVVDFRINAAVAWILERCGEAGLYGDHIQIRRPGVWPEADGLPAVHCGDQVLIGSTWQKAGYRRGNQIWAAAPPIPRPATPCLASVGAELKQLIADHWNFKRRGGAVVVMGLIGSAYYGAAAPWRPSGFLIGGAGSGKSKLLEVMRSACPLHHYTNDTSKAGLEQEISGRAMPSFIDEASDREDQRGARALLDLLLSASGGEGTKGHRGGVDGKGRKVEVVGSIVMASITPPDMQAQHLGRTTVVDLVKPRPAQNEAEQAKIIAVSNAHASIAAYAKQHGAALWGRAITAWPRYKRALAAYRVALSVQGCQPREMDQLGALLAGHWVLTDDGEPDAVASMTGVSAILEFIRDADEVETEDAPRRMINHLLSSMVMLDRSSAHQPIAALLRGALNLHPADGDDLVRRTSYERFLANYGMRVIRDNDTAKDARGRSAPRAADGNGVWFHPRHSQLSGLFEGTPFAGDRWLYELRRLESCRAVKFNVRIGDMAAFRCLWVSAEELGFCGTDDP